MRARGRDILPGIATNGNEAPFSSVQIIENNSASHVKAAIPAESGETKQNRRLSANFYGRVTRDGFGRTRQ